MAVEIHTHEETSEGSPLTAGVFTSWEVGSFSGTLAPTAGINVELTAWALFPMFAVSLIYVVWSVHSVDGASADAPRVKIQHLTAAVPSVDYDFDYRFLT